MPLLMTEEYMRQLSVLDQLVCGLDTALRAICAPNQRSSKRKNPAQGLQESTMTSEEMRHTAGLMRVNHAGEICAQALYQGQALTAQLTSVKDKMIEAAEEEIDHLAWCEQRLRELDSQPSLLNLLWYSGSFMLGALAGLAGDRWSLGFVAETERQVTSHLQKHLQDVPLHDMKTRAILSRMQEDEAHHAEVATTAGAAELPLLIKQLMQCVSKLLTFSSYYI